MRTAWVNRANASYPPYFQPPEITASSLRILVDELTS